MLARFVLDAARKANESSVSWTKTNWKASTHRKGCQPIYLHEGNIGPQSSQLAEPLWTDPGLKRGISVRELISTSKKKKKKEKKAQAGKEYLNILPKSS